MVWYAVNLCVKYLFIYLISYYSIIALCRQAGCRALSYYIYAIHRAGAGCYVVQIAYTFTYISRHIKTLLYILFAHFQTFFI